MSITRRSPAGQRDRWPLCLNDAAHGGNIANAVFTLRMGLSLERVPCVPK